jgi:hypothetical protein
MEQTRPFQFRSAFMPNLAQSGVPKWYIPPDSKLVDTTRPAASVTMSGKEMRMGILALFVALLQEAPAKSGGTAWIWWVILGVLLVLLFMRRKARKAKN